MDFDTSAYSLDDDGARARWRTLWENSPQRSAFSSLFFADSAAAAYGLRARIHFVGREQQDEAGAIVLYRGAGPFRSAGVAPFVQYSGLLLRRTSCEAAVHQRRSPLEAALRLLEMQYGRLLLLVSLSDPRPAQWRGWKVSPLFTYLLAPGTGLAAWSRTARRSYKKHVDAYTVTEQPGATSAVVAACAQSYARHGRALPTRECILTRLVDRLVRDGHARLFTVRHGGALEGGSAILHDGRTAHFWIAGSKRGPAMTVLLGKTLGALADAGISSFDFTGANTPSIAEFKRQFGARLTTYYRLEWRPSMLGWLKRRE